MADTDQVSDAIIAEAESAAETLAQVKAEIAKAVFGQDRVVELALAAVLAGGHALLIGAPIAFTAALALGIFVSNEVHAAAHARPSELPGWVRRLQRAGVIQSPLHHAAHHRALKNVNFCTLTDWTNPVLERVRFWRRLEALIRLSRGIRTRRDPVVRRQQRRRWRSA